MSTNATVGKGRLWAVLVVVLLLTAVIALVAVSLRDSTMATDRRDTPGSTVAPDPDGYFKTKPAGSWKNLPSDEECSREVHHSPWEPRPSNAKANHAKPDAAAVHQSLTSRPRGNKDTYAARYNTWLLPRVSGQNTGTTDENIQWAACKWGISDNLLRAMAAAESTWYQDLHEGDGSCVEKRGCGDMVDEATPASRTFCDELNRFGYDYSRDYGEGICPRTFSIIGVMSWQDPDWGPMDENQNGTFPFNRDSTAFALDYAASHLRGCMEGWISWLSRRDGFEKGDVWGCVGVWYAGDWKIPAARDYTARVKSLMNDRIWLQPSFAD
ncbi:hypothetical protein [Aeromicrobium sp. 9AM]|uniref:hypothetical protein n=1 Tax=Aeromicrobium sp. 9AM TaxID=2653126 RepID=UPI00135A7FA3|nr:hypothetical protein [Aeromicrobium sp. 9AM]